MRPVSFAARRRGLRPGAAVALALWILCSLVSGATQALCLDFGRECSPSASAAPSPCHEQSPENEFVPGCGSCVDIVVPDDASARSNRPDHDAGASAATPHHLPAADEGDHPSAGAPDCSGIALAHRSSPRPSLRSAVLLI